MTRLRRVSSQEPGFTRRRAGRGFIYLDENGARLCEEQVARVKALVIPPAWREVWICSYDRGHLQAVGTDDAGRRQYLYHPAWRERQDDAKHLRVTTMARKLPGVRRRIRKELERADTDREAVLALGVRLIDLGALRVGSDDYTDANGSYGLTTLELQHVHRELDPATGSDFVALRFEGKSAIAQDVEIHDADAVAMISKLSRRRDPHARLLAFREGRGWTNLTPAELNEHIGALFGQEVTAKDFRTWHGTVIVAAALAGQTPEKSDRKRRQQVRAAIADAADLLGNTPAVAERSYVDSRVLDQFEDGHTIAATPQRRSGPVPDPDKVRDRLDRAVYRLLA